METCPIISLTCFRETPGGGGEGEAKDLVLPPITVSQQYSKRAGKQAANQVLSTSLDLCLAEVGSNRSVERELENSISDVL